MVRWAPPDEICVAAEKNMRERVRARYRSSGRLSEPFSGNTTIARVFYATALYRPDRTDGHIKTTLNSCQFHFQLFLRALTVPGLAGGRRDAERTLSYARKYDLYSYMHTHTHMYHPICGGD